MAGSANKPSADTGEDRHPTDPGYWAAIYAGSVLGTTSGDLWAAALGDAHRAISGLAMLALCAAAIRADRRWPRSETWFWVAIVLLRAGATNFADLATHDWGLPYWCVSLALGTLTLGLAASLTRPTGHGLASPVLDLSFWLTMLTAGLFGTVTGDLVSLEIGKPLAASALLAVCIVVIGVRLGRFASSLPAYWVAVGCVRAGGTPLGDTLAEAFGLGAASVLSGLLFGAAVIRRRRTIDVSSRTGGAARWLAAAPVGET